VTIGIAWIRKAGRSDQLWVASDSRLSGDGNTWDQCPKLLMLPRSDLLAAFSGSTAQAYPLMLQIANSIFGHRPALDGSLELNYLLDHLEKVANSMLADLQQDPALKGRLSKKDFTSFDDMVLIGGFSRQSGLVLRTLRYEPSLRGWKFARVRSQRRIGPRKPFHIFGDRVARGRFYHLFESHLRRKRKLGTDKPLDFEPLEVLWDFVALPSSSAEPLPKQKRPTTVGGSVQAARVMAGAPATPCVIRWDDGDDKHLYLLGRRLLQYENVDLPLIEDTSESPRLLVTPPGQWSLKDSRDA